MTNEDRRTRMPPPYPELHPFPSSKRASIHAGTPDFPHTAGLREMAKFRESEEPGLAQVAVSDDKGRPVGAVLLAPMDELLMLMRAVLHGLAELGESSFDDLIDKAQGS